MAGRVRWQLQLDRTEFAGGDGGCWSGGAERGELEVPVLGVVERMGERCGTWWRSRWRREREVTGRVGRQLLRRV